MKFSFIQSAVLFLGKVERIRRAGPEGGIEQLGEGGNLINHGKEKIVRSLVRGEEEVQMD